MGIFKGRLSGVEMGSSIPVINMKSRFTDMFPVEWLIAFSANLTTWKPMFRRGWPICVGLGGRFRRNTQVIINFTFFRYKYNI